jgi:glutathione S-transferase
MDVHLRGRDFLLGDRCTIADVANYAYVHVAPQAGLELARYPAVEAWLARIEAQPGFIDDLEPYPANARVGAGSSIYSS